jgi:hypothetical protein
MTLLRIEDQRKEVKQKVKEKIEEMKRKKAGEFEKKTGKKAVVAAPRAKVAPVKEAE